MEVHLTAEEAASLAHVLDEVLSDMNSEVSNTDNARYKAGLRARRDELRAIRAKLTATVPA